MYSMYIIESKTDKEKENAEPSLNIMIVVGSAKDKQHIRLNLRHNPNAFV